MHRLAVASSIPTTILRYWGIKIITQTEYALCRENVCCADAMICLAQEYVLCKRYSTYLASTLEWVAVHANVAMSQFVVLAFAGNKLAHSIAG